MTQVIEIPVEPTEAQLAVLAEAFENAAVEPAEEVQYQLVDDLDPVLHEPIEKFDFVNPGFDPIKLATILYNVMIKQGGVGLSANQLGIKQRCFIMRTDPVSVCFNPMIIDTTSDESVMEEGCLSWPGIHMKIKRAKSIKVRFTDPTGQTQTEKYTGLTAHVFQHELDHLNGIDFFARAAPMARDLARRKWTKTKKVLTLKKKMGFFK
jgi:peptide deformylase